MWKWKKPDKSLFEIIILFAYRICRRISNGRFAYKTYIHCIAYVHNSAWIISSYENKALLKFNPFKTKVIMLLQFLKRSKIYRQIHMEINKFTWNKQMLPPPPPPPPSPVNYKSKILLKNYHDKIRLLGIKINWYKGYTSTFQRVKSSPKGIPACHIIKSGQY